MFFARSLFEIFQTVARGYARYASGALGSSVLFSHAPQILVLKPCLPWQRITHRYYWHDMPGADHGEAQMPSSTDLYRTIHTLHHCCLGAEAAKMSPRASRISYIPRSLLLSVGALYGVVDPQPQERRATELWAKAEGRAARYQLEHIDSALSGRSLDDGHVILGLCVVLELPKVSALSLTDIPLLIIPHKRLRSSKFLNSPFRMLAGYSNMEIKILWDRDTLIEKNGCPSKRISFHAKGWRLCEYRKV